MEELISRLNKWMICKKAPPYVLSFNMVNGCNQRCRFCDWCFSPFIENCLTDENYYRFIKQASKMNVREIRLCGGGEPLFKKNLALKMISLIKRYGMVCRLITNGTLFCDDDIKMLVKCGIDYIEFSIHGPDAETHDYLVSLPGAFDKVIHNVERFNYWKKKLKRDKPNLNFWFVITKINYNKLDKIIILASKLNIFHLEVSELFMRSKECKKLKLNKMEKNEVFKNIERLERLARIHHINFGIQEPVFSKMKKEKIKVFNILKNKSKYDLLNAPCYDPWYSLTIMGDGKFRTCPHIVNESLNLNLVGKTLNDIWYNEMEKVRDKILKTEFSEKCWYCCDFKETRDIQTELKNSIKN